MKRVLLFPFVLIQLVYAAIMATIRLVASLLGLLFMIAFICLIAGLAIVVSPAAALAYMKFKLIMQTQYGIALP